MLCETALTPLTLGAHSCHRYPLRFTLFDFGVAYDPGFLVLFTLVVVLVVAALAATFVYQAMEVRKTVAAHVANTRFDDSAPMRVLWWVSWAAVTVLYLPFSRTLLALGDCNANGDAVLPVVQPADALPGAASADAGACFGSGAHTAMFVVGLLLWLVYTVVAGRLAPTFGDISAVEAWMDGSWLSGQPNPLFLGPFTMNRVAAPVLGLMTFVVKALLAVGMVAWGRSDLATAVVVTVLVALLLFVGVLYPAFESRATNAVYTVGKVLVVWSG